MWDKLRDIIGRCSEIDELLVQREVTSDVARLSALSKERSALEPVIRSYNAWHQVAHQLDEARTMAKDPDLDVAALARNEISSLTLQLEALELELRRAVSPPDPNDDRNVIMEIRSGTGGDEAGLFAADLYRMYVRYAQQCTWRTEVLTTSGGTAGALKEVTFRVEGLGAYRMLRHESGVHRVQRIPATEAQGRIHTSTATVAVLPEAREVDLAINPSELRVDIFHSGGAGGQNVNKVATAVRIVHIPTGIMAVCQDERSQHKNRIKAMTVLRSRLLQRELQARQEETSANRRSQVGTGERSEKIRTYNFPQDRLTDHRIGLTVHGLASILDGNLHGIIAALEEEQGRAVA